mmetsp:Transcript_28003/g.37383  ORF Transcript_28003/g.37383 Transcript_28003/m.37383 type:complete len:130 (+) Transcript_28003:154-543(+)
MVLKNLPEISGKHLTGQIGAPNDFTKNKESGSFPTSFDLRVPQDASGEVVDETDLAGALDDLGVGAFGEKSHQGAKKSFVAAGCLATGADIPSDAFMPIKALNQFSTDWTIKARIIKKAEMRSWNNARG